MRIFKAHNVRKFSIAFVLLFLAKVSFSQVDSVKTNKPARIVVTGTITDAATNKPLVGVNLSVKDFSGTITDDKGSFKLNVPSYNADVLVSGEGYAVKVISLNGRKNFSAALLDNNATSFQETVTLPQGERMQRNVTASVTKY
ncbi:MAG: hypothetical protein EOP51_31375, partial [Sphingobacteriales bacterium]